VFNFTLKNVPPLVKAILDAAGTDADHIDFLRRWLSMKALAWWNRT